MGQNIAIFGGKPLGAPFARKNKPGASQHFGGSLPMSANGGRYETDTLGRLHNCRNVHVIDASVVSSVTGTPTTYTVMANAARIADQVTAGAS